MGPYRQASPLRPGTDPALGLSAGSDFLTDGLRIGVLPCGEFRVEASLIAIPLANACGAVLAFRVRLPCGAQ